MMHTLAVGLTAATLAGLAAPSAAAAAPAPGVPAVPDAPAPVTSRVDVDGDRRPDVVRVARTRVTRDSYTFRLSVATATGRHAIRDVTVANYGDGTLTPADVWCGAAYLDGTRGAEMQIERGGGVGDFPWPHVYTWRNNRIVPEVAPGATPQDPAWSVADHFSLVAGYSFKTVKGQRYVTATELRGRFTGKDYRLNYQGTRTTYRWSGAIWKRMSVARTGVLPEGKARSFAGWAGVDWRF